MCHTQAYTRYVWENALAYLGERAGATSVRAHMADPPPSAMESLTAIYGALLSSLRNRQAMFNTIGDIDRLRAVLGDFDPHRVFRLFGGDWQHLIRRFKETVSSLKELDPLNSRSYWVQFAKGALAGARFLKEFGNSGAFIAFVRDFYERPTTRPALPLLLAEEIHGFGFALACDFLKEIGFVQYAKPDVHVTDLFCKLGFCSARDLAVYRAVCEFAAAVGETPFAVDKVFWLIGSGNLYLEERRFTTNRMAFITSIKQGWDGSAERDRLLA